MHDPAGAVLLGAIEGHELSQDEADFFQRHAFAGVTLFSRNIPGNYLLVDDLTRSLQALVPAGQPPMLVAIDQEGGRVARIKEPFPDTGPAMQLAGGAWDEGALAGIQASAATVGARLRHIGINVNFAPVCDILTEAANTAIGDRAFGTDIEPVCLRAGAFLRGLTAGGALGCLKHFPGQGDAKVDTHLGRAVVDLPVKTLNDRELVPFRALAREAPMIMVSHCVYPQLDKLEASRSARILGGILRGEMNYDGVIVSDDMNMGAIPQDSAAWQEAIVEAVAAGVDLVLVCRHLDRCRLAHEALKKAAARNRTFRDRLEAAAGRVTKLRQRLAAPARST